MTTFYCEIYNSESELLSYKIIESFEYDKAAELSVKGYLNTCEGDFASDGDEYTVLVKKVAEKSSKAFTVTLNFSITFNSEEIDPEED